MGHEEATSTLKNRFSTPEDIELCRRIHKKFGTTYYWATLRFPDSIRWRVHGIYAFVRIADEWVDNPSPEVRGQEAELLDMWRDEMIAGVNGICPTHPALRVFCDAVRECRIPVDEAICFLDAMKMDLYKARYRTYDEVRTYMRGSASAVGVMMCAAMGLEYESSMVDGACALGEAMQLTNFLRDIGEDYLRGRVYLPSDEMDRYGVTEDDIACRRCTPNFTRLIQAETARARRLYAVADRCIENLPPQVQRPVMIARILYSQILDRIEDQNFDVFSRRASTSKLQKLLCAARVGMLPLRLQMNGGSHNPSPEANS